MLLMLCSVLSVVPLALWPFGAGLGLGDARVTHELPAVWCNEVLGVIAAQIVRVGFGSFGQRPQDRDRRRVVERQSGNRNFAATLLGTGAFRHRFKNTACA
jgi:hypothetical protein